MPTNVTMKVNWKRYGLYLARWQASTPIITLILYVLSGYDYLLVTVIANFIGGLIFFWVDQFIFTTDLLATVWEVREDVICADCGIRARGYRLVKSKNYDKSHDSKPKFRCEKCSQKKTKELKENGVDLND